MYRPTAYQEDDATKLVAFMKANSFATLISVVEGVPDEFREGMMNGIIGFEMAVTRLEGKYKLSQNRSRTDQQIVSESLLQSSDLAARTIGLEMKKNLESSG